MYNSGIPTTTVSPDSLAEGAANPSIPDSETVVIIREQPASLHKKLKDYQMVGMNWLYLLHREGLSGILADESTCGAPSELNVLVW